LLIIFIQNLPFKESASIRVSHGTFDKDVFVETPCTLMDNYRHFGGNFGLDFNDKM